MFRNYGNLSGDRQQPFSGAGSPHAVTVSATLNSSSSVQQPPKFTGARTGQFVPSLDAITSSQDLQWLVQPSLLSTPGSAGRPPRPPFPQTAGPRLLPPHPSHAHLVQPGVIRAVGETRLPSRRRNDEFLSQDDLEKRRIRRERNKMAAAKCRNRRRELTDTLQKETDELEGDKSRLQKEIAELQKEKEKLELVLEAHLSSQDQEAHAKDYPPPATSTSSAPSVQSPECESLHTPIFISTPSLTPFTTSLVFTYPSAPFSSPSTSSNPTLGTAEQALHPQPCGVAHRRSSSSGDLSSDHSLNSPTILTL
ncbi:hypothetical protein COCON_G00043990 [Conger conger]|uniref:BZIP domain-containing protein n=1 Tax=Conger conger TaxID=82655 RepID=A0A9Q1I4V1_CONCO|nr:hypothetical protein COCON_G00043990 [Conger conger]